MFIVHRGRHWPLLAPSAVALAAAGLALLGWAAHRAHQNASSLLIGSSMPLAAVAAARLASLRKGATRKRLASGGRKQAPADRTVPLLAGRDLAGELRRLMARSARQGWQGAVVLIEMVDSGALQNRFGPQAVEGVAGRIAGALLSIARDVDLPARISPFRFVLLVEGPLTSEEAAAIGPRLVARFLMPAGRTPHSGPEKVRVAQTLVGTRLCPDAVLSVLDRRLRCVPPHSRRAVFTVPPGVLVSAVARTTPGERPRRHPVSQGTAVRSRAPAPGRGCAG